MIGATAKAEQFQQRMGSESTKGSRKGFGLLGGGDNPLDYLTPEQQRDSLKRRLHYLVDLRKTGNKMSGVGQEIRDLEQQMTALRPRLKSQRASEIPNLFMDICREQMTKPQFKVIMDEANRRQRAAIDKQPCEVPA